MSNPAVYELAETKINNIRFRIEDNLGEAIHVHIGNFRVSLSIDEFCAMVDQMKVAADELLKLNGLQLDMFDEKSFDWDWLQRYEEIQGVQKVKVKIGELLTKGECEQIPNLSRIVPVSESRQYKALNSCREELERYTEKNEYGISNVERLSIMLDIIKKRGYPFDEKYILVNQYNQIYDGDHRAACLLFLKGADEEIPVLKITLKKEKTLEEQKINEQIAIEKYIEKQEEQAKQPQPIRNWSEELNVLNMDYNTFREQLGKLDNIEFYSIDNVWSGDDGKIIADKIIVIQENEMINFCKFMNVSYYGKSVYRYYRFLYSMQRCVYIELLDAKIMVMDRLSCKSKFEKAIMPLDKEIQSLAWKECTANKASLKIEMIYVIVDSLLNGQGFSEQAKRFVKENVFMLDDVMFIDMLRKVFFNYVDKLIRHLKANEFEEAYISYLTNVEY